MTARDVPADHPAVLALQSDPTFTAWVIGPTFQKALVARSLVATILDATAHAQDTETTP